MRTQAQRRYQPQVGCALAHLPFRVVHAPTAWLGRAVALARRRLQDGAAARTGPDLPDLGPSALCSSWAWCWRTCCTPPHAGRSGS